MGVCLFWKLPFSGSCFLRVPNFETTPAWPIHELGCVFAPHVKDSSLMGPYLFYLGLCQNTGLLALRIGGFRLGYMPSFLPHQFAPLNRPIWL